MSLKKKNLAELIILFCCHNYRCSMKMNYYYFDNISFGLKWGKNKSDVLCLLFCLVFSRREVATFDGCKRGHLNVISHLGLKSSWRTKMETLPWFQARWVCLFPSLFIRLYICLFLSHFNNPCPSRLCLVHWTVTSTLAGFAFLIPLCSTERGNIWRAVFCFLWW